MTGEPWRYRCPEGHAAVVRRTTGGYRCQTCQAEYDGAPVDLKTDETSDAEPQTPIHPLTATRRLWHATGDPDATARCRQFSSRPAAMAAALERAEANALVERVEASRATRWRVREPAARMLSGGET